MALDPERISGFRQAAELAADRIQARVMFVGVRAEPEIFSPRRASSEVVTPEPHSYSGFHLRAHLEEICEEFRVAK